MSDATKSYWSDKKIVIFIAVACALVGMFISLFGIKKHAEHYNAPRTQKYIVRIIFVVPVFAASSALSVIFGDDVAIVALILRDSYEAFVVYSFLMLILEYAGGEHSCIEQIKHQPPIRRPVPFCRFAPLRRDASLLRACKQGTLQFVAIKPIMAIISLCVYFGMGEDGEFYYGANFQVPLLIILNTSYSCALYYLVLFFFATRSILVQFNVVLKFVAVKIFVFATFWFAVLLQAHFKAAVASQMNNVILCYEMIPFALLLNHAFPYHEFFTPNEGKPVVESVRQMMNVGDVIQDAYHSFTPSYQDYVVAREAPEHAANTPGSQSSPTQQLDGAHSPQKVIRTRTYLIGNLDKESMEKTSPELNDAPHSDFQNSAVEMQTMGKNAIDVETREDFMYPDQDDEDIEENHLGFDGEWLNNVVEVDLKNGRNSNRYEDL